MCYCSVRNGNYHDPRPTTHDPRHRHTRTTRRSGTLIRIAGPSQGRRRRRRGLAIVAHETRPGIEANLTRTNGGPRCGSASLYSCRFVRYHTRGNTHLRSYWHSFALALAAVCVHVCVWVPCPLRRCCLAPLRASLLLRCSPLLIFCSLSTVSSASRCSPDRPAPSPTCPAYAQLASLV
jgi:hypothetical protein